MTTRVELAERFVAGTDWAGAQRRPLAGDASNRKYERLHLNGATAVLMDAPPDKGEDVRPFVRIARFLTDAGLSAPRILAEDTDHGFLLLEDLGDDLFARVVARDPAAEAPLYAAATDALVALHQATPPVLEPYSPQFMAQMAGLAWGWYQRGIEGQTDGQAAFEGAFLHLLERHAPDQTVLIQRDYHAENLLWLPDRDGVQRVGLLDFQDARTGHPAYDLVSLLKDARRDVSPQVERQMIARYVQATDWSPEAFEAAYQVLGIQRNLRILGVFARLSLHFNKPHYVDLIPRVWDHLMTGLEHPVAAPAASHIRALPLPTPENLQKLKDQAGCVPML